MSVKSRQRVTDYGEVFTSEREVNAMLDLVKQETERIESRFLEPACGNGNFLIEILRRKLSILEARYKKDRLKFERYCVIAVGAIYGVELLEDNVEDCRLRLFECFNAQYTLLFKEEATEEFRETIRHILQRNILWGDALTLQTVGEKEEAIVFSEWSLAEDGEKIKRCDYSMKRLLDRQSQENLELFSHLGQGVLVPKPVEEFPLVHYLELRRLESDRE
ncbi:MAG: SAM-dependent DNA methyltransferase [Gammaproteobacteria bacterium AqS3]|nr:SAM-dependent DNA methyltransferase [Gammaproteobacteria bacterium AqS3]